MVRANYNKQTQAFTIYGVSVVHVQLHGVTSS